MNVVHRMDACILEQYLLILATILAIITFKAAHIRCH